MKVRIGFGLGVAYDPSAFTEVVDALEELGFDSLWLSERVSGPTLDPLVGLAVAAGRTQRLKLGTSVQVLPGRNPVLLAKEWATLDVCSDGRALPAFGLGVVDPREQSAFAVSREERAARFDEALPLIRRLWTEESVDHDGVFFHLADVGIGIRPRQPQLDVWIGGRGPAELRRVGRLADGWLPSFMTPADAARGREIVVRAADAAGRRIDPEHWGALVSYSPHAIPPALAELAARRRPGTDPEKVVPVGYAALRQTLEAFIAEGFTKLVPAPFGGVEHWDRELAALADATLDLTT